MFGQKKHIDDATKVLLIKLKETEERLIMKLSEVKADIATAAQSSREAFQELSTKIADLQKQIDDLIAGVGDPEITDEAFLKDLQDLKTDTQALADIVPNTPPVPNAPPAPPA